MTTDITEKGLETLIMRHLTGTDGLASVSDYAVAEALNPEAAGTGWFAGSPADYDRAQALDVLQLFRFLEATQPEMLKRLDIGDFKDTRTSSALSSSPAFLPRLARMASSTCYAKVSSMSLATSISSSALLHPATLPPPPCSPRTASLSPASFATVSTKLAVRSISVFSSMAYPSRPSS